MPARCGADPWYVTWDPHSAEDDRESPIQGFGEYSSQDEEYLSEDDVEYSSQDDVEYSSQDEEDDGKYSLQYESESKKTMVHSCMSA